MLLLISAFFLDGLLSRFFLIPLFTFTTHLVIPRKNPTWKNYLLASILGFLIDLLYTTSVGNFTIWFFLEEFLVNTWDKKMKRNKFQILFLFPIILFLFFFYETILFYLFKNGRVEITYFFKTLIRALPLNYLYAIILSLFLFPSHKKRTLFIK